MKIKTLLSFIILIMISIGPAMSVYGIEIKDEKIDVLVGEVYAPIYNVDIVWDSMNFNYNEQVNYSWDDANHTYLKLDSIYKWESLENNIRINNESSTSIKVQLEYISTEKQILGNFDKPEDVIQPHHKKEYKLNLNGMLDVVNINYVKVGFINLKIS